jgi:hypothetical protein
VLHLRQQHKPLPIPFQREPAMLADLAAQHRPHLPERRASSRDIVDGQQQVAHLHSILTTQHGRLAVEIGDRSYRKFSISLWPQGQPDHIEIWKVKGASNFEIYRRVCVIKSNPIVEQRLRTKRTGYRRPHRRSLSQDPAFRRIGNRNIDKKQRTKLQSIDAH